MSPHKHGYHQRSQIWLHIAIQFHQLGEWNSTCQSPGNVKEESARRASSASGFPSRDYIRRERIVHGRSTGVHQQSEGGKALGKIAHCLSSLLSIRLCRALVRGRGVQHADDGSEHRKGVGTEVDGEEVLRRGQTSVVRLKMVCVRRHLDKGVDCVAFLLSGCNR